jgi:hypothetical protein
LKEHKGHAGAEEDDACFGVCVQFFVFEVFFPEGYGLLDGVSGFVGEREKDEESTLSVSQSFLMQSTSSTVTESLGQSLVYGLERCERGRAYIECRDLEPVSLCRSIAAVRSTHN